jgi:mannose-6-phosphate isomerase-like protein (cupin superfamily)
MAITLEGGCRVSDMCEGEPVFDGTLRIRNQIGRANGAQAISLRVMEISSAAKLRNGACDEILYVVGSWEREECWERSLPYARKRATNEESEPAWVFIDGHRYEVGPDTGIYIRPGETFVVVPRGLEPLLIISVRCPEPEAEPAPDYSLHSGFSPLSDSLPPKLPPLVRLADRKAQPTADRWYRVLVDDEIGSTQATQFVGSIPPGRAPDHFHHYEEVLFILKGEGRMWAGETNTPIAAGSCIYLPKGQVHCVENTGEGELRLLGVFYPAGSPSVRYDA